MPTIFLSHSSLDKPFTRRLAHRLKKAGVKVWIDEAELRVGDSLLQKLGDAISSTDYVGAVISKHSVDSEWVKKELQIAMAKEIADTNKVVLPILIDDSSLPAFLSDKIYADFRNAKNFNDSFLKLIVAIGLESEQVFESLWDEFGGGAIQTDLALRSDVLVPITRKMPSLAVCGSFERMPHPTRRVLVFWSPAGISKEDALHITGHLSSQGILANVLQHRIPRPPDAFYVARGASQTLVRSVLQSLSCDPSFIFPFDYKSHECGAPSEYVMSVGLHSDFHGDYDDPLLSPVPISEACIQQLRSDTLSRFEYESILARHCETSNT